MNNIFYIFYLEEYRWDIVISDTSSKSDSNLKYSDLGIPKS